MNTRDMPIRLVRGEEADALLAQEVFTSDWSRLAAQCPWATGFQTPEFAGTWYLAYRDRYEPVLAISYGDDGHLQGLLPLAASRPANELVVAGGLQAEYQAWICPSEFGDIFPLCAVRLLRKEFPAAELRFCYLPPRTPMGWVGQCDLRRVCLLQKHRRPLLRFGNGEEIERSLKRDTNRNRLRHLQKIGPLAFRRITDAAELEALLDTVIPWHDARHLAVHGVTPFADDPRNKPFLLATLRTGGLVHATAMTVGDQLVTLYLGLCRSKEVVLCSFAYNPWLAKYSPGKFHSYFLARMLMQEGYEQLDLTPGGDAYKERFANAWEEVHTLEVFPGLLKRQAAAARVCLKESARTFLNMAHIAPKRAMSFARKVQRLGPGAILWRLRNACEWIYSRVEFHVSVHDVPAAADQFLSNGFRRDCLDDLLAYRPHDGEPSRQGFMAAAFRRIEEGQHAYSYAEDGRLLELVWLMEGPLDTVARRWLPGFPLSPRSALALGFYTHPQAPGRGLEALALQAILGDVARAGGIDHLVVAGPVSDDASRQAAPKQATAIERRLLGCRRAWRLSSRLVHNDRLDEGCLTQNVVLPTALSMPTRY